MNNIKYRIRKLTEVEVFRLMGLTKEDCDKCKAVGISNTQLYKQAGNGIVSNCIELIFEHLYKSQYNPEFKCFDENFTQPPHDSNSSGGGINGQTISYCLDANYWKGTTIDDFVKKKRRQLVIV